MKLGLSIGYWGSGTDAAADQLELVQEAERQGYDSAWTAEAYGSDAATVLAWLAAQTTKIRLGSAIFQMPGRSPAMTAMTAATIDQLSGGRMILGLGPSGPRVAEGWHGQPFAGQLNRTREYVAVVRMALARERVQFDGAAFKVPLKGGTGNGLKLTIARVQERIPIYPAAIGPKNIELAGEIGDGWIPAFFSPEYVREVRVILDRGLTRSGRSLASFEIVPKVNVFISDDSVRAHDVMRPVLALYIGGMGSREENFYNQLVRRLGFEETAQRVQDLYLEGKRTEAGCAIPDQLIDLLSICGPRATVRERLRLFRDAGAGTVLVTPMGATVTERIEQVRAIAELID